ncbi:MAG TPA: hypothetical protein VGF59_04665 [Bryobacteraceae bacterium]
MKPLAALALLLPLAGRAAELKPQTLDAFQQYVRQAEQKLDTRKSFLWADESPDRAKRARGGEVIVQPVGAKPDLSVVGGGLVHDWIGTAFIPGATLDRTLRLVKDYNRHKDIYKPEVIDSRILSHSDDDFHIYMRLLKKKVITVVLNTEHDVHYVPIDKTHARSVSRTTKIAEVEDPGKPEERALPPESGHGFLWRLNSYWRFEERDGGTWVECEAISLTRDVPTGLGWLIEPIIRNLPKESLVNTLEKTKAAL